MVFECLKRWAFAAITATAQRLFTIHYLPFTVFSVSVRRRDEFVERRERGLFAVGEYDEPRESEQLEKLERVAADVREDDARALLLRRVDDAEQDRDPDAVDQLGAAEVDDERAAAGLDAQQALALDAVAALLVDVVARVNDGDIAAGGGWRRGGEHL